MLAGFKDRHDIRVIEPRGGRRFRLKAGLVVVGCQPPAEDHLHGDVPAEAQLAGAVNDTHPAASQLAEQFIVAPAARQLERRRRIPAGVG